MITSENVAMAFTTQPADGNKINRMGAVNAAAFELAAEILHSVPAGADQQAALRKVREAAMTANKGIVTDGAL